MRKQYEKKWSASLDRLGLRRFLYNGRCAVSALFPLAATKEGAGFYLSHELEAIHAAPIYFSSDWRIFSGEKIGEQIILDNQH